jgi:sugar/nucleoside kinase (ribokinase family)
LPSTQDVDVLFGRRPQLDALRALRAALPDLPVLVVKCGADGALVHRAGSADVVVVPAVPAAVRDATGAGDAFCGGFLSGFAAGGDVVEAALRGAVSASYALGAVGPAGLVGVAADDVRARQATLRVRIERVALAPP